MGMSAQWKKPWSNVSPRKGFATLIVDPYTPRGQAYGVCDEADSSELERSSVCMRGAEDAYAALNALAKLPDIDPKRVFLLGYGHAGNSAILATDSRAAANHPLTFAGVISYWPWCGWGTDFPVPTLVLIGEKDRLELAWPLHGHKRQTQSRSGGLYPAQRTVSPFPE